MPLDVIGPLHPTSEFDGASPVMPQIEVDEIDRLIKRLRREEIQFLKRGDDVLTLTHKNIYGFSRLVGISVEIIDPFFVVTIAAYALHAGAVILLGWPAFADGSK